MFFATGHTRRVAGGHQGGTRAKAGKDLTTFDIAPTVPIVVGDDLDVCARPVRPYAALYVGGMGSREKNFYKELAARMGFGEAAQRVQDLYLSRDYDGAAAAVPAEFVDSTSLLGTRDRIAERMVAFAEAGVTTLSLSPFGGNAEERIAALRTAADALDKAGLA